MGLLAGSVGALFGLCSAHQWTRHLSFFTSDSLGGFSINIWAPSSKHLSVWIGFYRSDVPLGKIMWGWRENEDEIVGFEMLFTCWCDSGRSLMRWLRVEPPSESTIPVQEKGIPIIHNHVEHIFDAGQFSQRLRGVTYVHYLDLLEQLVTRHSRHAVIRDDHIYLWSLEEGSKISILLWRKKNV